MDMRGSSDGRRGDYQLNRFGHVMMQRKSGLPMYLNGVPVNRAFRTETASKEFYERLVVDSVPNLEGFAMQQTKLPLISSANNNNNNINNTATHSNANAGSPTSRQHVIASESKSLLSRGVFDMDKENAYMKASTDQFGDEEPMVAVEQLRGHMENKRMASRRVSLRRTVGQDQLLVGTSEQNDNDSQEVPTFGLANLKKDEPTSSEVVEVVLPELDTSVLQNLLWDDRPHLTSFSLLQFPPRFLPPRVESNNNSKSSSYSDDDDSRLSSEVSSDEDSGSEQITKPEEHSNITSTDSGSECTCSDGQLSSEDDDEYELENLDQSAVLRVGSCWENLGTSFNPLEPVWETTSEAFDIVLRLPETSLLRAVLVRYLCKESFASVDGHMQLGATPVNPNSVFAARELLNQQERLQCRRPMTTFNADVVALGASQMVSYLQQCQVMNSHSHVNYHSNSVMSKASVSSTMTIDQFNSNLSTHATASHLTAELQNVLESGQRGVDLLNAVPFYPTQQVKDSITAAQLLQNLDINNGTSGNHNSSNTTNTTTANGRRNRPSAFRSMLSVVEEAQQPTTAAATDNNDVINTNNNNNNNQNSFDLVGCVVVHSQEELDQLERAAEAQRLSTRDPISRTSRKSIKNKQQQMNDSNKTIVQVEDDDDELMVLDPFQRDLRMLRLSMPSHLNCFFPGMEISKLAMRSWLQAKWPSISQIIEKNTKYNSSCLPPIVANFVGDLTVLRLTEENAKVDGCDVRIFADVRLRTLVTTCVAVNASVVIPVRVTGDANTNWCLLVASRGGVAVIFYDARASRSFASIANTNTNNMKSKNDDSMNSVSKRPLREIDYMLEEEEEGDEQEQEQVVKKSNATPSVGGLITSVFSRALSFLTPRKPTRRPRNEEDAQKYDDENFISSDDDDDSHNVTNINDNSHHKSHESNLNDDATTPQKDQQPQHPQHPQHQDDGWNTTAGNDMPLPPSKDLLYMFADLICEAVEDGLKLTKGGKGHGQLKELPIRPQLFQNQNVPRIRPQLVALPLRHSDLAVEDQGVVMAACHAELVSRLMNDSTSYDQILNVNENQGHGLLQLLRPTLGAVLGEARPPKQQQQQQQQLHANHNSQSHVLSSSFDTSTSAACVPIVTDDFTTQSIALEATRLVMYYTAQPHRI